MTESKARVVGWAVLPLVLLALVALIVGRTGVLSFLRRGVPPVEQLTFERVVLKPNLIQVTVVNGGPDAVRIAQVMVDEAFWDYTIRPGQVVPRLGRATLEIPYPWVRDEPHEVTVLTSSGLTFSHEIPVAVTTPTVGPRFFALFALIGLYVGVIPVAIGLLWYPLLRRLDRWWLDFVLALTAGLLLFLGADTLQEALESAEQVPGAFQGAMLVVLGAVGTLFLLQLASHGRVAQGGARGRRAVAALIALGIGLHNLGEGLAIGAAYALGEVALGAFLIVGFMLHNTTEGLGIVAPIAKDDPPLSFLVRLGLVAGGPTILGAWLGGMAVTPFYATLFMGIGAGAIAQVVLALFGVIAKERPKAVWSPATAGGVLVGLLVMYATGLLVAG